MNTLSIIDDLATHGLSVCDQFLTAQEVANLHACLPEQWTQASIGREQKQHTNTQIRTDKIHWLERGHAPAIDALLDKMSELQLALNRHLFLGLFEYEAHFAKYNPGDFYAKHVDAFKGRSNRKVTTVLYLNHDWCEEDGGEIVIYHADGSHLKTLWPQAGRLVTFLSEEFPHEVLPAKRQRFSIAGWYRINGMSGHRVDPIR